MVLRPEYSRMEARGGGRARHREDNTTGIGASLVRAASPSLGAPCPPATVVMPVVGPAVIWVPSRVGSGGEGCTVRAAAGARRPSGWVGAPLCAARARCHTGNTRAGSAADLAGHTQSDHLSATCWHTLATLRLFLPETRAPLQGGGAPVSSMPLVCWWPPRDWSHPHVACTRLLPFSPRCRCCGGWRAWRQDGGVRAAAAAGAAGGRAPHVGASAPCCWVPLLRPRRAWPRAWVVRRLAGTRSPTSARPRLPTNPPKNPSRPHPPVNRQNPPLFPGAEQRAHGSCA